MLNRKPTARRQRRRSNGSKPRRCSAPTVLGPPRVQLDAVPFQRGHPQPHVLHSTAPPIVVPVAHSVDSGVTWLKAQRAYAQQLAPGQSSYQLWPGYGNCLDGGSLTSGSQPTPPPSEKALYESTVVWTDVDDPDQAFSLLGSLCEAGVETNNPCDFIFRAFFILSGTWPVTVFLVGLLALPSHDNYWCQLPARLPRGAQAAHLLGGRRLLRHHQAPLPAVEADQAAQRGHGRPARRRGPADHDAHD
ncbi:uncharacterized protein LOC112559906 isoform X2 [Pomacea canaliculata]|uniref:uncharacterized protein LOC112559906 isoform X2 n=1 Tax=Pomacea canaliculata TaxID=400727 RepID=UPI000D731043|nr:uncharacterized protein LOC112559906 isoform X2 [Pomacea canaliculata]